MILSGKADNADGLTPFKEEKEAWRNKMPHSIVKF